MRSYFVLFLIFMGCVGVWVYVQHPEYIEQLKSPETQQKLQMVASEIETTAQKTFSQVESKTPEPVKPKPFIPPDPIPQQDNWTWTTTTGAVYHNVKIVKIEADCVTILHSDGGARIDTGTLPPDLQRQLNYSPAIAQDAAAQRSDEMAYTKQQLSTEAAQIKVNELNAAAVSNAAPLTVADPDGPVAFQISTLQAQYDKYMDQAASFRAADSSSGGALASHYEALAKRTQTQIQYWKTKLSASPAPATAPAPASTNAAPAK